VLPRSAQPSSRRAVEATLPVDVKRSRSINDAQVPLSVFNLAAAELSGARTAAE